YTMIPMIFMIIMTTWGMAGNFFNYLAAGSTLLAVIDGLIILLEIWMIIEAVTVLNKIRQTKLGIPASPR
ncbi:MAG: carbon starvation protein A, partial [Bacillota bacterium]